MDYVKVTLLGLGLSGLWGSLHSIVLPLRLLDVVPEALKNSYLGYMTFAGLVLAMLVQPVVGAASDRSGFAWGRRRPFILAGSAAALVLLPGIGLWETYASVFACYCLLQIAGNTAQGPYQGLLPDLVPAQKRGLASGVKSLLEIIGGVTLARLSAPFMDRYSAGEGGYWLWLTLGALGIALLVTAVITLLTVHERPGVRSRTPILSGLLGGFRNELRRNPAFLWFLASRGLLALPGVILQTFALYYLIDVVGVERPAETAADLFIAVGAGLVAVVYFAGRLSDRIGRRPILVASGLVGTAGIVLLFFASGVVIGLANGALLSSSWALATDLAPRGSEAQYLGLTNLALAAGSALARLVGPLIDHFNAIERNLGYSVMLLICLVGFVAGSLLILKVRPPR
jgi:Na+/melibiose symporter-like transporter